MRPCGLSIPWRIGQCSRPSSRSTVINHVLAAPWHPLSTPRRQTRAAELYNACGGARVAVVLRSVVYWRCRRLSRLKQTSTAHCISRSRGRICTHPRCREQAKLSRHPHCHISAASSSWLHTYRGRLCASGAMPCLRPSHHIRTGGRSLAPGVMAPRCSRDM